MTVDTAAKLRYWADNSGLASNEVQELVRSAADELDKLREEDDTRWLALLNKERSAHAETKRELEEMREQLRFIDADRVGLAMDQEQLRARLESSEAALREWVEAQDRLECARPDFTRDQLMRVQDAHRAGGAHFARFGGQHE